MSRVFGTFLRETYCRMHASRAYIYTHTYKQAERGRQRQSEGGNYQSVFPARWERTAKFGIKETDDGARSSRFLGQGLYDLVMCECRGANAADVNVSHRGRQLRAFLLLEWCNKLH